MEGSFELTLQIVLAVLVGISAQVLGEWLKVPSIVFLLSLGILLGQDGLHWLRPNELGVGLEVLVALGVAIILFEGGLNLNLRELGQVSGSLRNLVTIGTLITLVGGGMAAHWLSEFPWPIAFLYAALVVVTGPTVIGPLLKQVSVDRRTATLLEGEGVLIDPVGAILAVVVLDTILTGVPGASEVITGLLFRLGIGAGIGATGGWFLGWFLKRADFLSEELKNLVVLAGLWSLFGLAQKVQSESGLMAVVIAGIVLGASSLPEERMLRRFKGQLTVLCVSVLFVLLSADLSLASVAALGWGSLGTVLILMFVVRPLSVLVCTAESNLNWRQKFFLAWVAPKGIVSASVASLFAILLAERNINGGDAIKALVFLTIIMTVFLQGLTAQFVARGLRLGGADAKGAVIIGCNPVGRLMGRLLQEQGQSVVLIDTDPEACAIARAQNLPTVESSGLDTDVLEEAGIESMGSFVALTSNGEVNVVLAQRAAEEFSLPRVLAVFPYSATNKNEEKETTKKSKTPLGRIQAAFIEQVPIKTWNTHLRNEQIKLGRTTLKGDQLSKQKAHLGSLISQGELLPLLLIRQDVLRIIEATEDWSVGDEIIYLFHDPRPQLLKRLSGDTSPAKLVIEELPRVEDLSVYEASAIADDSTSSSEPLSEVKQGNSD